MKSMAVAGTALSLIGTVTKNPKLAKIGAVVGTVGSLGAMGAFGAGAKTLGMSSAAKAAAATTAAPGAVTSAATRQPSLARQALSNSTATGPLSRSAGGYGTKGLLDSNIARQATMSATNPAALANTAGQGAIKTLFQKTGSALQAGTQMVKDNPELANIIAAGGVELSNYLSGKTDAEIRQMESSIDANDANAQRTLQIIDQEKKRRQNLNQGYLTVNPVITLPGQANTYQPPGLLAQNMARPV
jgi:hypothetical protein